MIAKKAFAILACLYLLIPNVPLQADGCNTRSYSCRDCNWALTDTWATQPQEFNYQVIYGVYCNYFGFTTYCAWMDQPAAQWNVEVTGVYCDGTAFDYWFVLCCGGAFM